jgi:hypothetical protein
VLDFASTGGRRDKVATGHAACVSCPCTCVEMTAITEHGYGFHSVDVLLKVALLPLHTSQPLDAVKQQLNNMLFKYSESLEGVPLSYSDISFPKGKEFARIMADQFWLHVDICTKLVIFKPVVGQRIRGKVNKVRPTIC